jgi:hypothetical protein
MTNESGPYTVKSLDDKWLKAAVLGSLWASFEIIVGSLLHNLRVPFAGTFLTLFAVILLISFSRIWPQRGIILRAGIICALMKSISPSAVILGPMVGIFTEALIVEFILLLMGRNIASYIIAGALAVLSSLLHKLVNLMILYGLDLIEVYVNMIEFAGRQLEIITMTPQQVFYIFIAIYLITGAAGGVFGFYLGGRAVQKSRLNISFNLSENPVSETSQQIKYSLPLLSLHFLFLVFSLLIFEKTENVFYASALTLTYLVFTVFYYRNISRRLMKPLFWVQLLIILILAGLFIETSDPKQFSLSSALTNGWLMFMRAILVISSFSAISTELANPKIKNLLMRKGFHNLYMALQLAFSALPVMLENHSGLKSFFKNPVKSFSLIISNAENWLESFKKHHHQ